MQRDVLPIPDRPYEGLITYDAKDPDTSFPPIEPLRPPAGRAERAGRAARRRRLRRLERVRRARAPRRPPSASPANGLKYNRFHTTALCSPTRQALLTGPQPPLGRHGRDHRDRHLGARLQLDPAEHGGAAGRDAEAQRLLDRAVRQVPRGAGLGDEPDGPVRRLADAAAAASSTSTASSAARPTSTRRRSTTDTVPVEPDRTPGGGLPLHRGHDRPGDRLGPPAEGADARQAVLRVLRARAPRTRRTTCRREWSDKYKGRFDQGWDALREETFARQKELGVIPRRRRADRAARGDPGLGRHARRPQAGARPPDGGLRRLPGAHRPPRRPADRRARRTSRSSTTRSSTTSSATTAPRPRARRNGTLQRDDRPQRRRRRSRRPSSWRRGSTSSARPTAYNHYAVGWAHAMDTPYQWTKQVASHWGGTRNGTIVHWPNGFEAQRRGALAVHHVIDVAPTVLDAAGLPAADLRARRPADAAARREHGADLRRRRRAGAPRDAVLRDVRQPRHLPQGLDRGHPPQHPVGARPRCPPIDDDVWELYAPDDWTQAHDLCGRAAREARRAAAAVPDRGGQVQRAAARRPPRRALQRRPRRPPAADPAATRSCCSAAWAGCPRTRSSSSRTSRTRSPRRSTCPTAAREGVIIAQGGAFGGWSLYLHEGRPAYCYNLFGLQRFKVYGEQPVPAGEHQVRMEFAYDGGGLGKGGDVDALRRRREGRRGPRRAHRADGLLRPTRRPTSAATAPRPSATTTAPTDALHRPRPLGPDRHRRGRRGPRPPDHPRGAPAHRDGAPVEMHQCTRALSRTTALPRLTATRADATVPGTPAPDRRAE